ncbi:hypothetical protein BJX63DRAFT_393550 [Aspergillus granulosus]|uniref:Ubiquitin-like protease family profile domain-containing protein n=1 Tax=Aspergillus granulosus TaxID=176169 RepID=A0ABR4HEI2_9EURO
MLCYLPMASDCSICVISSPPVLCFTVLLLLFALVFFLVSRPPALCSYLSYISPLSQTSFPHLFRFESSFKQHNRNMDNPTTQQPEVEDVIMKDASLISDESPMAAREGRFDPMHISTPLMEEPQPSRPFTLPPDEQNNFDAWLGPNSFLANPPPLSTLPVHKNPKLPALRPPFRFSPKGKGKFIQPSNSGIAVSRNNEIGVRMPSRSVTGSSYRPNPIANPSFAYKPLKPLSNNQLGVLRPAMTGFSNYGSSTYDRPYRYDKPLAPIFQRANTSRDSSFSSFDSQKSTEDGKADSFDSLTSVSTNQSSLSRKRSIDDEAPKSNSHVANKNDSLGLITKYRRLSADGLGIPSGNIEVPATSLAQPTFPSSPSQRIFTLSTPTKSLTPTKRLSPTSNPMDVEAPVHKVRDSQQSIWEPNGQIPGCWPTPSGAMSRMAESSPYANSDQDIQMGGSRMSDPLLLTSADHSQNSALLHSPFSKEINMRDTEHDSNEPMILVPDAQAPASAWHAYYAAVYASLRNMFQNRIVQTMATVFRGALAYAGSIGQNTLGLFERRGRRLGHRASLTARQSPVRANIRTMPVEQQQRLKANQWRKDRGLLITEGLPFPKLSFDSPHIATSPNAASQPGNGHHSVGEVLEPATKRTTESVTRPTTTPILKKKPLGPMASTSGVRKKSRLGPLSATAKARLLGDRKARGRMERALNEGLRTGNFEKMEQVLEDLETSQDRPSLAGRPVQDDRTIQTEQLATTDAPAGNTERSVLLGKKRSVKSKTVRFREPLVTPSPRESRPTLMTELAPHLRPSPPNFEQFKTTGGTPVERKENAPLSLVTSVEPVDEAAVHEDVETTKSESPVDPWSRPPDFPLGRPMSAVSLFYPKPRPLPPGRTESIYADEFRKMEEQRKLDERPMRIRPDGLAVRPLPPKWQTRLEEAMRYPPNRKIVNTLSGDPLTKKDLETCFTPMRWLNDEVINSYLALIIDYLRRTHGNAGRHDKPRFHAFNSFFFSNLRDKGYDSVRRWATRAKIGGKDLLNVDTVFVPVHNSHHWTLIVVKPSDRTIENFDSLGSLSPRHVAIIKTWLRGELGEKYIDEDWTVLPSVSPQQDNGSDCGVFLLSTAKAVAFHIEPMSYGANDTTLLRKKIVAELMNGGFEGDFDPTDEDGETLL